MHHLVVLGFLISQLGKMLACEKNDDDEEEEEAQVKQEEEEAPGEFVPPSYILSPLSVSSPFIFRCCQQLLQLLLLIGYCCSCCCQLKQPLCLQWRRLLLLVFPNYLLRLLCFNLKLISKQENN